MLKGLKLPTPTLCEVSTDSVHSIRRYVISYLKSGKRDSLDKLAWFQHSLQLFRGGSNAALVSKAAFEVPSVDASLVLDASVWGFVLHVVHGFVLAFVCRIVSLSVTPICTFVVVHLQFYHQLTVQVLLKKAHCTFSRNVHSVTNTELHCTADQFITKNLSHQKNNLGLGLHINKIKRVSTFSCTYNQ